jgi:hypothetical protein
VFLVRASTRLAERPARRSRLSAIAAVRSLIACLIALLLDATDCGHVALPAHPRDHAKGKGLIATTGMICSGLVDTRSRLGEATLPGWRRLPSEGPDRSPERGVPLIVRRWHARRLGGILGGHADRRGVW